VSRVVVIGAGMGGLAVAARLARQGHQVIVCEQADTYGGKLGQVARDGHVFDTGPSLLTLPAVYRDLFLKTATSRRNAALEDNVDLIALDPAFGYRFGDGTEVVLPGAGVGLAADALGDALGGDAADQWRAFMRRAADIWSVTRGPFLESPLDGPRDLVSLAWRVNDLRTVAPWRTLRGLGRSAFRDPRLVTLLDRYATYTGSDPRRAPAALASVPYVEQTFGAWHVGGGLRRLGEALHQRCLDLGVEVRLGADVAEVLVQHGQASGVRLQDDTVLAADLVVADADASHLYRDLVTDPRRGKPVRGLDRATPSLSGFSLLLALRGRTPGIQHHNVWFPGDYDAEFDAVFGRDAAPVADPTVYACVPDDPLMRPDDEHESWFVLVNAPRHGSGAPGSATVDWTAPRLAERYADQVLAALARRGVDVRDRVLWRQVRTPADLERETRSPGGGIYGTSSNGARAAFLRPSNRSPVPGLFLVGGSSHPGGGLPLVGLSAAIVADLVGPA
jgi:phytoene desaturase